MATVSSSLEKSTCTWVKEVVGQYAQNLDRTSVIPTALAAVTGAALMATDYTTLTALGGSSLGFIAGKIYCHPKTQRMIKRASTYASLAMNLAHISFSLVRARYCPKPREEIEPEVRQLLDSVGFKDIPGVVTGCDEGILVDKRVIQASIDAMRVKES